jgi:transposase
MIKAKGKQALAENGLKYISALTDAQVRKLLKQNVIQPGLFDKELTEVEHDGKRLVMRLNEQVRKKEAHRRDDKLKKLEEKIKERNKFVAESKRADPQAGLRGLDAWAGRHRLKSFITLTLDGCRIKCEIDDTAKNEAALLDGCYVLETDVAKAKMDAQSVDAGYRNLQRVERDFRRMKTTLLEVRPIFLRKANRTEAHVFAAVLALKISREMESRLHGAFGADEDGKQIMTIDDALRALSRLSFLIHQTAGGETARLPRVDERQAAILAALGVPWSAGRGRRRAEPGRNAAGKTTAKTEHPTI